MEADPFSEEALALTKDMCMHREVSSVFCILAVSLLDWMLRLNQSSELSGNLKVVDDIFVF